MSKYNPQKIERKWQRYWETKKFYNTKDSAKGKKNFMMLAEFPYTSGNLHIGHWFTYSITDIFARYLKMNGYNVMNPIGFDAFGLPAENAAIKSGTTPELWTKKNISYMSKQLKSIGATFDWSRTVDTSKPDYYRWTQWIFLKLYEKGLAYRAETKVNWCPKDRTVLANEQVVNGLCERCDTPVVQKDLTQWMFKITDYSDALIDDIKDLDWPETTKLAQINWIGRSEGTKIKFMLSVGVLHYSEPLEVFTTRADTLFGVSAVIISPELAQKWIRESFEVDDEVEEYIKKSLDRREMDRQGSTEKTGVPTGIMVTNPINGEKVPVWVADYVLGHYGTGAVMLVPAHDQRDWEFAKKYNLPAPMVVCPNWPDKNCPILTKAYEDDGHLVDSDRFTGLTSEEGRKKITEELKLKGLGDFQKTYRLHDWILSRQRYWGVPIPMINCPTCGYQPVAEKELPIKLSPLKNFKPADDGRSPLAKAKDWLKVKCPKCGGESERETDTMDTFVDSSWYFIRYTDPKNKKEFASKTKMNEWLPVPMYIGGREHNTMHLLYARFITKALHGLGLVDLNEPFISRRNHGVIMGPDGKRMSKSRGNVVDPDIEVKKYGTDAVRINFAFMGPFDQDYAWNNSSINGIIRFLNRVWNLFEKSKIKNQKSKLQSKNQDFEIKLNQTIKKIGDDIKDLKFNTCISELMKLLNEFESVVSSGRILHTAYYTLFLKLLAPFAPHLSEELWSRLHSQSRILDSRSESGQIPKTYKSIHLEKWPEYDEKLLVEEKIRLVVQVNGRVRDTLEVSKGLSEEEAKELATKSENVKKHITGEIKKVIYVQDRIINFVI
ncbi:MAG: leucine--tRNA ligase [Candidatus Taylorbacteria bacterium]|nr:leucine--tRNA ligase [Candidatus Taylorbacteria bacterium]